MLYLVRKLGESIIINDNIEVKVVEIKGKSVKLGFEFPDSATVLRKEIHDRVVQENLAASAGGDSDIDFAEMISKITKDKNKDEPKSDKPEEE